MLKKTLFIWLSGFLTLFFVEACERVTMNAPYFITVQIGTLLLYAVAGCVSGLVFWFILFSLRNIFPKTKMSYSYISMSAFISTLFLGGWRWPIADPGAIVGVIQLLAKMFMFLFLYIWLRATLPRFRYDQLMNFGWKYLLPLGILNLLVTGLILSIWS